jgi:hypothetical protein
MKELTKQQQIARLRKHEEEWLRAKLDADVNHDVAVELGDVDMLKQAKEQMMRAEKALKIVRDKIAALEE